MITQIGSVITRIGSRDHCGSGLETRCGPWALPLCSRAVAARPAVITGPIQLITRLRSRSFGDRARVSSSPTTLGPAAQEPRQREHEAHARTQGEGGLRA